MFGMSDKVNGFKKIGIVEQKCKAKNLTMIANVDDCTKTYKPEEEQVKVVIITIKKSFSHAV